MNVKIKRYVFRTVVGPELLHGMDTWSAQTEHRKELGVAGGGEGDGSGGGEGGGGEVGGRGGEGEFFHNAIPRDHHIEEVIASSYNYLPIHLVPKSVSAYMVLHLSLRYCLLFC